MEGHPTTPLPDLDGHVVTGGSGPQSRAALVAALWARFRPLVDQRVDALESYATSGGGTRQDAAWSAHNLAGSLGSYGKSDAGRLARDIDLLLQSSPQDTVPAELPDLVADLKDALADVEPEG